MAASRVLVFGGRGFVGAAVCRELARRGIPAVSLGRSEKGEGGELGPGVEHMSGVDAQRPETYKTLLADARAVVICIGLPPWVLNRERAITGNGLTNVSVVKAAAEQRVSCVVLVNATMPSWRLIANYREGKEMAEAEARRYPETSGLGAGCEVLVLKPGMVSGTRYAGGRFPVPLWCMFGPMRLVMTCFRGPCKWLEAKCPGCLGGVLAPPVHVEELAAATADAVAAEPGGVRSLGPDRLVGYKAQK